MNKNIAVVILAAGKGTRMKSDLPKVLHPLAQRPMILHVLDAIAPLKPSKTIVITGHGAEEVEATIATAYPKTEFARQTKQLGTGHAVLQAEALLKGFNGTVLILNGDVPLVETPALEEFISTHYAKNHAITLASTTVLEPVGMGRVIRTADGKFMENKEHKDCTPAELEITEINVGFYAVNSKNLFPLLHKITNNNVQKEYYLPDIIKLAIADNLPVEAEDFPQPAEELTGINDKIQLAEAEFLTQNVLRAGHLLNGITMQDPQSVHLAHDTKLGQDVTIEPNVVFGAGVSVANNVIIKAFSHLEGCTIASGCSIGPFARIRPETNLAENVKIGNFVELKKANVGNKTSIGHLSYVGNAEIGENVNIGAGTILANYHHFKQSKNTCTVKNGTSIGANNVLVAPVTIAENTFTGAGTVVRKDTEAGSLVADKPEQIVKKGYK